MDESFESIPMESETIDSSEEQHLPMELGDESCHSVR